MNRTWIDTLEKLFGTGKKLALDLYLESKFRQTRGRFSRFDKFLFECSYKLYIALLAPYQTDNFLINFQISKDRHDSALLANSHILL